MATQTIPAGSLAETPTTLTRTHHVELTSHPAKKEGSFAPSI